MVIAGREKLHSFAYDHADARRWLENWLYDFERVEWRSPQDLKNRYPKASILPNNVVIFDVKGSDYRLEVQIAYNTGKIFVKWIGTHKEYDRRNKQR